MGLLAQDGVWLLVQIVNKQIARAEAHYGSGAEAARVLGVSYESWKKWKSGERKMPLYIDRSITAHLSASVPQVLQRHDD